MSDQITLKYLWFQAVSDSVTFLYILTTGYYVFDLMIFILCSRRFSNVSSYIFHHIVSLCLLYFSWMLNAHRAGSLIILVNNIIIYFFLSIAKVTKHLDQSLLEFITFWTFFFVRNVAKIIFLRISYIGVFETNMPVYPAYVIINSFMMMLIVHNVYFTNLLFKMAQTHYSFESLRCRYKKS